MLPFLANTPTALHAGPVVLRFGAGATQFVAAIASIAFVLAPAVRRIFDRPEMRGRVRSAGIASSARALCIGALMLLRPGAS